MPWSGGLESQRGNLTSLLGTLAQMKEGKKNRRSQIFNTLLGIGGQLGGAALQNKWSKDAAAKQQQAQALQDTIQTARTKTAGEEQYARSLAGGELDFQREKELAGLEHGFRLSERKGEGEDTSRLTPFNIASQAWDDYWGRIKTNDPKRMPTPKDFDNFRAVAAREGAPYSFTPEQMELAVNDLAQSLGFTVAPQGGGGGLVPGPDKKGIISSINSLRKQVQGLLKKASGFEAKQARELLNKSKNQFPGIPLEAKSEDELSNILSELQSLAGALAQRTPIPKAPQYAPAQAGPPNFPGWRLK